MRTFKVARGVYTLAYSPDGRGLWVGDGSAKVHRCDPATGECQVAFRVPAGMHTAAVYNLSVSADGRVVAASSYGRDVLWDVASSAFVPMPGGDFPSSLRSSLSPNGKMFCVAGPSGDAILWDRPADELRHLGADRGFATNVAFSADSRLLAVSVMEDPGVVVYDPHTGDALAALDAPSTEPMLFSPDGSRLVTGCGNDVILWETAGWTRTTRFRAGQAFVRRLAMHPNGRVLATAGDVPVVSLWDTGGKSLGRFDWEVGKVQAVAFAPDGMTAAVGGTSGRVAVWDVEVG